ncbi:MAG: aminopeptidase N [Deltaproteobacteria bacterium]
MSAATRQPIRLKDYKVPPYLIPNTKLRFELGEESTEVQSILTLQRNPLAKEEDRLLRLHGEGIELLELKLNGAVLREADYQKDEEFLTIKNFPDEGELSIRTRIKPQDNTTLEGLYKSNELFCTQCEAEGFRHITYFLDRPDVLSRYTTTIIGDQQAYPTLLSNGNPIDSGSLSDGRHYVTWEDPFPKPSYLFALVAGNLECLEDSFQTVSGKQVALRIYTEHGYKEQCHHAMESLKKAMRWDEERFGLEYDLEIYMIVAVQDFNFGAMENKGLNIFNARYILSRFDTATDEDFENIESVVAHEYFHNYTGNRVTCRDWFQLSLKEGLTVFRDQEFTSDLNSRPVKRIQDVRFLRDYQFPEDAGPTAHPVRPESFLEINNFYTVTVYEKGSELIRMLQTLIGREAFTQGVQHYLKKHDGQAATVENFLEAIAESSRTDLEPFRAWYRQAGTPRVSVRGQYSENKQEYELHFEQSYPQLSAAGERQAVPIPIQIGLLNKAGGSIASSQTDVFLLEKPKDRLVLTEISEQPIPSLLRQFSAPVRLEYDYSPEELALLYQRDSDEFNRWDAGQRLATMVIEQSLQSLQQGQPLSEPTLLLESFEAILRSGHADLSFLSQLLTLPSEGYLSAQFQPISPNQLREALWGLHDALSIQLSEIWQQKYKETEQPLADSLTAEAIGKRRFRNLCLSYLGRSQKTTGEELAFHQFEQSQNMTEAMGALNVLTHQSGPLRLRALESFYQKWQNDALVLDKWFRIQAASRRENVLDEVEGLLKHEKFSYRTPNRVRALVGGFSQGNFFRFHQEDGRGYQWLASQIQALDKSNPQVAARLLTPLVRWQQFAEPFQSKMHQALQQIANTSDLSKDVFEIVSKSLGESA